MRWKTNKKMQYSREISAFLFFPLTINGETRWLEKASWVEKLCYQYYNSWNSSKVKYKYTPIKWKD